MPEIRPAQPSERKPALELLQRGLTTQERQARFDRRTVERIALLVAVQQNEILGAIGWQAEPNQTALVWAPRCRADLELETVEEISLSLLKAATEKARQADLDLAQMTLSGNAIEAASSEEDRQLLQQAGYKHLANLLYLACTTETMPAELPPSSLEFEPYEETEYERLSRLIEATYEGTLDCPGLNGIQSIDTVIEGYRNIGRFLPQNWRFVRHEGQDIGCLLLAKHPDQQLFELVYMGMIPEARGKGWGYDIARFAQWTARTANASHLVVAVDATNHPAVSGYQRAGFFSWDCRAVYIKNLC